MGALNSVLERVSRGSSAASLWISDSETRADCRIQSRDVLHKQWLDPARPSGIWYSQTHGDERPSPTKEVPCKPCQRCRLPWEREGLFNAGVWAQCHREQLASQGPLPCSPLVYVLQTLDSLVPTTRPPIPGPWGHAGPSAWEDGHLLSILTPSLSVLASYFMSPEEHSPTSLTAPFPSKVLLGTLHPLFHSPVRRLSLIIIYLTAASTTGVWALFWQEVCQVLLSMKFAVVITVTGLVWCSQ